MTTSRQFRERAAAYRGLSEESTTLEQRHEFLELERSFNTLADNEQWLEKNQKDIVHAPLDTGLPDTIAEEERMLRCLGAAVILQWNTLPTKLQRELFNSAGDIGDTAEIVPLRGEIARFLHKHKNDRK
jgi:hypothetical protein